MATITCLKELEERGKLEYEDIVKFTINKKQIIKYRVVHHYLLNTKNDPHKNDEIFKILRIDKVELAEKAYKYKLTNAKLWIEGYWPQLKSHNFPALTRLVKELYLIIEEPVYTKFTRFEIMEI